MIPVHTELRLGHLRCDLTDMPPQPNSPPDYCLETKGHTLAEAQPREAMTRPVRMLFARSGEPRIRMDPCTIHERRTAVHARTPFPLHSMSTATMPVVVFHFWQASHLYYTSHVTARSQTRVKLNRVFFPRRQSQVRSLDCCFAGK